MHTPLTREHAEGTITQLKRRGRRSFGQQNNKMPVYVCLDAEDDSVERECLSDADGWERHMLGATSAAQVMEQADLLARADVVAVWHTIWLDDAMLRLFRKAKVVVRMGVGFDNVDIEAAGALSLPVCNVPDYGTEEVADAALALILSLYRGTWSCALKVANGERVQGADGIAAAAGSTVRRVRGSKLGLVGLGRIGTATAVRAKAFGFDVLFFDPFKDDGLDKALGITRVETLEELVTQSACVSLHCNCTESNVRMVDKALLDRFQPGAMLVNTARGELVDESSLADALKSGQLSAAALDVHWDEPFVKGKGPLGDAPNLLCTPHLVRKTLCIAQHPALPCGTCPPPQ